MKSSKFWTAYTLGITTTGIFIGLLYLFGLIPSQQSPLLQKAEYLGTIAEQKIGFSDLPKHLQKRLRETDRQTYQALKTVLNLYYVDRTAKAIEPPSKEVATQQLAAMKEIASLENLAEEERLEWMIQYLTGEKRKKRDEDLLKKAASKNYIQLNPAWKAP